MVSSKNAATRSALSTVDWQVKLSNLLQSSSEHKIVFIGVGHPLRGDDYVGSYVAKELIRRVEHRPANVDFFDAEDSVESVITKASETEPKHVIFIDSCQMNAQPGEIHLVSVRETEYPFFTTHGIPLKLLSARLLSQSEAWVLAIQPKQVEFSEEMSSEVCEAGLMVSQFILNSLWRQTN